jgi:hypothetical protein
MLDDALVAEPARRPFLQGGSAKTREVNGVGKREHANKDQDEGAMRVKLGNKDQIEFHSKRAIKDQKDLGGELSKIQRLAARRMLLTNIAALLAIFGLILTVIAAEFCRFGYIPDEEEIQNGMPNPYDSPDAGCRGKMDKKIILQAFITFSTLLLGVVSIVRYDVSHHETEKQIMHMAKYADPPDIAAISIKERRARRRVLWIHLIVELFLTVLPHPLPGFQKTFTFPAGTIPLWRAGTWEFEGIVVVLMYDRFWHVWRFMKASVYYQNIEHTTYALGNSESIMTMFSHRKSLQNGFALKMLFSEYPIYFVMVSFLCLLFMSAYSFRAVETPVNLWHSEYFGNQLWLMIVTMTTVGYGDNVPATALGRAVCVMVMVLGTILVALMTAACTEFLNTNTKADVLVTKSNKDLRRKMKLIVATAQLLQYQVRVKLKWQKEDWKLHNQIRINFVKALQVFRVEEEEDREASDNSTGTNSGSKPAVLLGAEGMHKAKLSAHTPKKERNCEVTLQNFEHEIDNAMQTRGSKVINAAEIKEMQDFKHEIIQILQSFKQEITHEIKREQSFKRDILREMQHLKNFAESMERTSNRGVTKKSQIVNLKVGMFHVFFVQVGISAIFVAFCITMLIRKSAEAVYLPVLSACIGLWFPAPQQTEVATDKRQIV